MNVVMVGSGKDVLQSLLRAGWHESERPEIGHFDARPPTWKGRRPDAVFRHSRKNAGERHELKIWLAPMQVDGQRVWIAQVTHHVTNVLKLSFLDPDIDDARDYLLQDLWYSQSIAQVAWSAGPRIVTLEEQRRTLVGAGYFTDGYRVVVWLTGEPIGILETLSLAWDEVPE